MNARHTVDLLVVGSGTGMAAALATHEEGLTTLVAEKTAYVGGSTARSGGAFWIPANPALRAAGAIDSVERASDYLRVVVGYSAPEDRWRSFLAHGSSTVDLLRRRTPLRFTWAREYADYHAELPGGAATGRSCECRPFDASILGPDRERLRPAVLSAPVPMPVTGADYRWMNLVARVPGKAVPRIAKRAAQGIGGMALGREYLGRWPGTGRGIVRRTAPGRDSRVDRHLADQAAVRGRPGHRGGTSAERQRADGDCPARCRARRRWFRPRHRGSPPIRSLPGSLMVDGGGRRFVNEATDYMSFGQQVLARERAGDPMGTMWLVFDQRYRNSYVFAGSVFPRIPLPRSWYDAGIAHRADTVDGLARTTGCRPANSRTRSSGSTCSPLPGSMTTSTAARAPTSATTAIPR
ncbi:FAD-binding protein [Amycolatopsis lurida]